MTNDKKTVPVESLVEHTYEGITRPVGAQYDAEPEHVETLETIGYARRVTADDGPDAPDPSGGTTRTR